MIFVKYSAEMPDLHASDWEELIYKKSWFYDIYKLELRNFFIKKEDVEKLNLNEKMKIFKDFFRFLKGFMDDQFFKKYCNFEIIMILENKNGFLKDALHLDHDPEMILVKITLFQGKYDLSYQYLDDIKTINCETIK